MFLLWVFFFVVVWLLFVVVVRLVWRVGNSHEFQAGQAIHASGLEFTKEKVKLKPGLGGSASTRWLQIQEWAERLPTEVGSIDCSEVQPTPRNSEWAGERVRRTDAKTGYFWQEKWAQVCVS